MVTDPAPVKLTAEDLDGVEPARAAGDGDVGRARVGELGRQVRGVAAAAAVVGIDHEQVVLGRAVERQRVVAAQALVDNLFDSARRRIVIERRAGVEELTDRDDRRVGDVLDDRRIDAGRSVNDLLGARRLVEEDVALVAGGRRGRAAGDEHVHVPDGAIGCGHAEDDVVVAGQGIDEQYAHVDVEHADAVVDADGEILDAVGAGVS
jgi:hypothetical protein